MSMRCVALIAIALGSAGATAAAGQTLAPPTPVTLTFAAPKIVPIDASARLLNAAAFAPKNELQLSGRDTLRINVGPALPAYLDRGRAAYDVTLVRSWPKAVSFDSEKFNFDIAPHAGVGASNRGGQVEGGATLTVSPKSRGQAAMQRLRDMGVADGASYGSAGRWYLFAAASGQAVGLNMIHDGNGWDRAGWSTDNTGALVGDAQVGVGWRKGDMQSSFGVIHREVKGNHMIWAQDTRDDTVAAFTFSIRPGR
jgi:hypothetical protein